MPLKKKLRIIETPLEGGKLGDTKEVNETSYVVYIHPEHCSPRSRMNTVVHEALHVADFDGLSESKVRQLTAYVVECLWREGYRRKK
jgi:hypothetical protein